jgi:hypothetical protein
VVSATSPTGWKDKVSRNLKLRRRSLFTAGLLLLGSVLAGGFAYWWTRPRAQITPENYWRILTKLQVNKEGIPEDEVIAILSGPAGDYSTLWKYTYLGGDTTLLDDPRTRELASKIWQGDECRIELFFEKESGRVVGARCKVRQATKTD